MSIPSAVRLMGTASTAEWLRTVEEELRRSLPALDLRRAAPREPPAAAYHADRDQWFAPYLLRDLPPGDPALWLVPGDLYARGMNFVFGLAVAGRGAVVSTARMPTASMLAKEAVHEAGHVLGLEHCAHACVMRFSNDLADALRKPSTFCARCRALLDAEG